MKLKEFKINHGGKFNIDTTGPFVCYFDTKKVGLTGDEEAGKTTALSLFEVVVGQLGGEKALEALRNKESGKIDLDLKFVGNDRAEYTVRVTNSQFIVARNGEEQKSPKEFLRQVFGVVGTSPMKIKDAPIEEIVRWLASYSTRGVDEFEKEMLKIKNNIKLAKKGRAEANKVVKAVREYLISEGYADESGQIIEKKWVDSEKRFAKKVDIKALSSKLDEIGKRSDRLIQAESKLKQLNERKESISEQISRLQKELDEVNKSIEAGEKYVAENKSVKKEYDEVKAQYDCAHESLVAYEKWQEIKRKVDELNEFETVSQKADGNEKALIKKQQELQWEVIPDIRGVEIVLEDTHEDEGEQKKAAFYYNGMTSRQLSASQWFGVVVQILKKNKVPVLLVDDISTLGSGFMKTLDSLVNAGTYVLYAEMKRGQTELTIEYN